MTPLLYLIAKNRKNGAPKNAVTTPIGISVGLSTFLATRSQNSKKSAPAKVDIGIKTALFDVPSIILKI